MQNDWSNIFENESQLLLSQELQQGMDIEQNSFMDQQRKYQKQLLNQADSKEESQNKSSNISSQIQISLEDNSQQYNTGQSTFSQDGQYSQNFFDNCSLCPLDDLSIQDLRQNNKNEQQVDFADQKNQGQTTTDEQKKVKRQYCKGAQTSKNRTKFSQQTKRVFKVIKVLKKQKDIFSTQNDFQTFDEKSNKKTDLNQNDIVELISRKNDQKEYDFKERNRKLGSFLIQNKFKILKLQQYKKIETQESKDEVFLNNRECVRSFYSILLYIFFYESLNKHVIVNEKGKVSTSQGFMSLYQHIQQPIHQIFELDDQEKQYFNFE